MKLPKTQNDIYFAFLIFLQNKELDISCVNSDKINEKYVLTKIAPLGM